MKLQIIQENMTEFDALLLEDSITRRYITGFSSSSGMLLIMKDCAYFFTDFRYIEDATNNIKNCHISKTSAENSYLKQITEIIRDKNIKNIGFESEKTNVYSYEKQKKALCCKFSACDDFLSDIMRKKTDVEMEKVLKAQEIAEKSFEEVLNYVKAGKSEKDIASYFLYSILKNGAEDKSFPFIVASGENSSKPHAVPCDRILRDGDFVTFDFGCMYDGYCSDTTRTIAIGHVTDEMQNIYDIVLNAQEKAIKKAVSGVLCSEVDDAARSVITHAGFGEYFGHSTGHGIGIRVHEMPQVSPLSESTLQEGDIISAEPGIYLPGKFGVRTEDMLYIREKDNLNLTKFTKSLIIV